MRLYKSNYSFVSFVNIKKSDGYIKRHGMWTKSTKSVPLYDIFPSTKPMVNDIKTIIVGSVFDLRSASRRVTLAARLCRFPPKGRKNHRDARISFENLMENLPIKTSQSCFGQALPDACAIAFDLQTEENLHESSLRLSWQKYQHATCACLHCEAAHRA